MAAGSTRGGVAGGRAAAPAVPRGSGRRQAAVLGLAACLLMAVAVGTRGSPGGSVPVPSTASVWQTAAYAVTGLVIGISIAGLPLAVARRRGRGGGRFRALSFWQRLGILLTPVALLIAIALWEEVHPLTGGPPLAAKKPSPGAGGVLPHTIPPAAGSTVVMLLAAAAGAASVVSP